MCVFIVHLYTYKSIYVYIWAVLRDEQMSNGWPFSLLNDEQMSNKVGVEHQPVYAYFCTYIYIWYIYIYIVLFLLFLQKYVDTYLDSLEYQ